jgi:hypothetical protein
MFFKETRFNAVMDRLCHQQFIDYQRDVQSFDLHSPIYQLSNDKTRKYVVQMGIYREDMFSTSIPMLTWLCQNNGHIWCEWQVSAPQYTAIYNEGENWGKLSEHTHGIFNICIPMSRQSIASVLAYSKENIVMHKLTSSAML